jgi:purine nucleosidase
MTFLPLSHACTARLLWGNAPARVRAGEGREGSTMTLVHVDTDIGGDTDDLCALAMLLGWQGTEIAGVTTSSDQGGMRAGLASYTLRLAGRGDVPVAAGAEGSIGSFHESRDFRDLSRYWPEPVDPDPLTSGCRAGPYGQKRRSRRDDRRHRPLDQPRVTRSSPTGLAGLHPRGRDGWLRTPPRPGLGPCTPEMDYNVQQDVVAARIVWDGGLDVAGLFLLSTRLGNRADLAHQAQLVLLVP